MHYVFVVNPIAGKQHPAQTLLPKIEAAFAGRSDYEVYLTRAPKDATRFVTQRCRQSPDEELCFFACGGDGTLNEVVCGMARYQNAVLAMIPCGSGNDFVKSFPGADFCDLTAQLSGVVRPLDLIRCNDTYSVNICSAGLDADVCENMLRFKRWPLVNGFAAYYMALAYTFFSRIGKRARISLDGGAPVEENAMLLAAANGRCYGGGFWGAPEAVTDDGLLDVCFVRKIPRWKMATLVPLYQKGGHIRNGAVTEAVQGVVEFCRCKKAEITFATPTTINVDGEIYRSTRFAVEVLPGALRLLVPKAKD